MSWLRVRVGDLGSVFTGRTPPTARASYFGGDYPFVTPSDMHQGKFARVTGRSLSAEGAGLLARIEIPANSVCVSCIGWQMGEVVMTDRPSFTNQQINTVVPNDQVDPSFLFYSLKPRKQELLSLGAATGVRTPILNKSAFSNLSVALPPLVIQGRIARILSAYDDLIENCKRRIEILELMIRALYREWFVHYRFPGHEDHPRVASSLGEIPQGWEVAPLCSITTKIGSGATPRGGKAAYKIEGIPLIRSLNIYDYQFKSGSLAFIGEQQAAKLANVVVEKNDVLLNITGASVARCALAPSHLLPARVNQHVAIVRADLTRASPFYLLDAINSEGRKSQLLAFAQGGATREALTKETVGRFEIVLPPASQIHAYDEVASSVHQQREVLSLEVDSLCRTRDLLLPRLLSGQIDPSAA